MAFPPAADGAAVAAGSALADAGEADPEAGCAAADVVFGAPAAAVAFALTGEGEDDPVASAVGATPPVHIFR